METFTPTDEQLAIVNAATETNDNLLVNALAGAAKTSTLILIAEALKGKDILTLAFNKKIATEMKERLPAWCESKTLNALGHKIWWEKLGRARLTIDSSKTYAIVSSVINNIQDPEVKGFAYEAMSDLIRSVDFGKACGWVPDAWEGSNLRLMDDAEFFGHMDEIPTDWERDIIHESMMISLRQAWGGLIDFNDQILMPTVFYCTFPSHAIVMVDEAQDLSALNHAMLAKLCRRSRLIAVGDPCQAIYGFRGAHEDSMDLMQKTFQMKELYLTTSFRCPIAVVHEARWRAPAMKYPDWAIPGEVRRLPSWSAEDLIDNDVIICRNNAPLFAMAIKLLRDGRYPELIGNDIGKALIKIMKKFGKGTMTQADAFKALEDWKDEKLSKTRNPGSIHDRAACIMVFLEQSETLAGAIAYAEHIFSATGSIKLMTGHKSKGLEFDRVFFLDEFMMKKDEGGQDRNLRYVTITRAKQSLTYVRSEDYVTSNVEAVS